MHFLGYRCTSLVTDALPFSYVTETLTFVTNALEVVYLVDTDAVSRAVVVLTLIYLLLAVRSSKT